MGFMLILSIIALYSIKKYIFQELTNVNEIHYLFEPPDGLLYHPTRIFDRSGKKLLFTFSNPYIENVQYYRVSSQTNLSLPKWFITALIEQEDPNFWKHPGYLIDWISITNPAIPRTIQEKLLDKYVLDEYHSLERLLQRYILASQITKFYGRERIIEWYANNSYFGRLSTGIDAAAQTYFNKRAYQLNLAESALLAVLIDSPNDNPYDNPLMAEKKRNKLLTQLLNHKKITREDYLEAIRSPIVTQKDKIQPKFIFTPFIQLTVKQLADVIGWQKIEQGGLDIISTQDYDLQHQAECLIEFYNKSSITISTLANRLVLDHCQSARYLILDQQQIPTKDLKINITVLDSNSSQVLVLASSPTYNDSDSIQSGRSPGTLLFPFYYLTGLMNGLTPSSFINTHDVQNSTRLRAALLSQAYVPTTEVVKMIGKEQVRNLLEQFGIRAAKQNDTEDFEELPFYNSSIKLLDLAHAYATLANYGKNDRHQPEILH
jgi:membrane carboxypeptidase/penicillin-binding protein